MQSMRGSAACFGRRLLVNFALDAIEKAKFPNRRGGQFACLLFSIIAEQPARPSSLDNCTASGGPVEIVIFLVSLISAAR
jgi:hypothetical protein